MSAERFSADGPITEPLPVIPEALVQNERSRDALPPDATTDAPSDQDHDQDPELGQDLNRDQEQDPDPDRDTSAAESPQAGRRASGSNPAPAEDPAPELRRAVERYLDHLVVERGLAENTLAAYRRDLARYQHHLTTRAAEIRVPRDITTDHVRAFLRVLREGEEGHPPLSARSSARVASTRCIRGTTMRAMNCVPQKMARAKVEASA